jgi:peptidyl-prolyl cis-trans isomerase D
MLKFFSRLERTRNFFILIFAILMVISLVFWQNSQTGSNVSANLAQSEETVAVVGGHYISLGELVRQQENESRFSQGRGRTARAILDELINARITRIEAERLGLTASDREVADRILQQERGEDGKPFDRAVYERNVKEQFGSISTYEQSVRDSISSDKLFGFLTAAVTVSEEEVLSDFQRKNTKFDLSYVQVSATELAKKITPTDQELRAYFENAKASYYINVPQKKIKYVFINTAKIGEKLNITEADLRAEYDALPPDKKIGGVLGQEIVLRVARPEFDTRVLEKANELVQQLKRDGDNVSEETFATVAKGHSENPATAAAGGKLSGPVRENPNKPEDPYQRLLKMQPGQITEPINYQGRYFILRRGADVPKAYEVARKEIEVSLRNRRAYGVASELAQKIVESLKETKDPVKTAQAFAAQANMSVAEMVRETAYVKPGDDVPNIGVSAQFEEGIQPLNAPGDVGERTPIPDGFAVPMLVDRKEPRDAEFEEVRDKIVDIVKLDQARSRVEEIAERIAERAGSPAGLGAAASAEGFSAKEQKSFVLGSPLGEGPTAGTDRALEDAIFALKPGSVAEKPYKVGDNWFIVAVSNREDASMDEFAKQRTTLIDQKLTEKRNTVFTDYMLATRLRMEKDGLITIYKQVLEKVESTTAPEGPAGFPAGFPGGIPPGAMPQEVPGGIPGGVPGQ